MWVVNPCSSASPPLSYPACAKSVSSVFFSSLSISITVSLKTKNPTSCCETERMACVMYSLGCFAPSAWQSHKSFIFLHESEAASQSYLWNGKPGPHVHKAKTSCAYRQQQGDLDWFHSYRTWIKHVLICISKGKSWQSKTEPNKDVGALNRGGESAFSWTCSESLTQPISKGLALRPSGDASPALPSSWHNCSSWGRAGECT